ncbi:MAG: phosphodiester glycosidase family protein [Oscillospiraceae bacterium]|jgi:exopolysaccharide biosynthesis protein|nr:phosphodiester glycosidase family protein [Oscillospiraceae bacterium]
MRRKGMIRFFSRPFRFAICFSAAVALLFTYAMLETFVLPREMDVARPPKVSGARREADARTEDGSPQAAPAPTLSATTVPTISELSYSDDNISITIETVRLYGTTVHIADVRASSPEYIKTAFAQGKYGRNIKETTSGIAMENNAILAVNGDYYGFTADGYVLRNGTLYRTSSGADALVMDDDGDFHIVREEDIADTSSLWQVWSFGPALINDGAILVDANSEVSGRHSVSNPRTAIGQIEPLHYIFLVSEGRTGDEDGLTLLKLAQILASRGCIVAYNFDGGGSSAMWFNGTLVNAPTTDGKRIQEREVSDIVYIGY